MVFCTVPRFMFPLRPMVSTKSSRMPNKRQLQQQSAKAKEDCAAIKQWSSALWLGGRHVWPELTPLGRVLGI